MTVKSKDVYRELYRTVSGHMRNAGESFPYYEETFMNEIAMPSGRVDVSKYLGLDNKTFMQAVFQATYKRLPEKKEEAKWSKYLELPRPQFQNRFLRAMVNSSVTAIYHIQFINNPYFKQRRGPVYTLMGFMYGMTDKSSLRVLGKKMPLPVQKLIRRIFI